jgi:AraC family transcriptional activator of pobA
MPAYPIILVMIENFELINPVRESPSFSISHFDNDEQFSELKSYNYFVVVFILKGKGSLTVDSARYNFSDKSLLSFSLYQPFQITCKQPCEGYLIAFHPDFFCLHQHRSEVSCNGILFNNIYESLLMGLTSDNTAELLPAIHGIFAEMRREQQDTEVLISYLKILLITASRIKVSQRKASSQSNHQVTAKLMALQAAIEENFKSIHQASAYADLLNHSQAALNKSCKEIFHKTLSELIADRIILEAKRELYLTGKPVKAIAYDLGFTDEFHFSRYFKRHIGISPQFFRDTVGVGKANAA